MICTILNINSTRYITERPSLFFHVSLLVILVFYTFYQKLQFVINKVLVKEYNQNIVESYGFKVFLNL